MNKHNKEEQKILHLPCSHKLTQEGQDKEDGREKEDAIVDQAAKDGEPQEPRRAAPAQTLADKTVDKFAKEDAQGSNADHVCAISFLLLGSPPRHSALLGFVILLVARRGPNSIFWGTQPELISTR